MIIGYSPGGGYDLYGRVLAQHMTRHIPGNPKMVSMITDPDMMVAKEVPHNVTTGINEFFRACRQMTILPVRPFGAKQLSAPPGAVMR